jgi:antitoxin component of MazEF toxin-antitoxin module
MDRGGWMTTQIKKIGNSKGIIIPSAVLKIMNLKEHDELTLIVEGNDLIVSKGSTFNPQSLDELFEGYNGTYNAELVFFDDVGREKW